MISVGFIAESQREKQYSLGLASFTEALFLFAKRKYGVIGLLGFASVSCTLDFFDYMSGLAFKTTVVFLSQAIVNKNIINMNGIHRIQIGGKSSSIEYNPKPRNRCDLKNILKVESMVSVKIGKERT